MCNKKLFFIGMVTGVITGVGVACVCDMGTNKTLKAKAGKTVKKIIKAMDDIM